MFFKRSKEIRERVEAVHELVREIDKAVGEIGCLVDDINAKIDKIGARLDGKASRDGDFVSAISQTFGNLGEKLERIEKALEFSGIFNAMSEPIKPTAEEAVSEKTREEIEAEGVTVKQIINEWLNGEENEG